MRAGGGYERNLFRWRRLDWEWECRKEWKGLGVHGYGLIRRFEYGSGSMTRYKGLGGLEEG